MILQDNNRATPQNIHKWSQSCFTSLQLQLVGAALWLAQYKMQTVDDWKRQAKCRLAPLNSTRAGVRALHQKVILFDAAASSKCLQPQYAGESRGLK